MTGFSLRVTRHPSFSSSFLNCTQIGFNFLLRAESSWDLFWTYSTAARPHIYKHLRKQEHWHSGTRRPVFREIVTPAEGEVFSHFGSGSASLGFRHSSFVISD